jgi:glycosyltransferase involved in cell wall biosynthesis
MTQAASVVIVMNGFQVHYEAAFSNALAANGVAVELIASDLTRVDRLAANVRSINLRGSQAPDRNWLRKVINVLRYQRDLIVHLRRCQPVAVHLAGWFSTRRSFTGILEALVLRSLGRPFVFTVHNILPHDRRTRWEALVHRLLYAIPHHLVVHTDRVRDELIARYGVPAGKICVMQHGIADLVRFDAERRDSVRSSLGVLPSQRLLLMFGNVARYKGADLFVEAMGLLDQRFVAVIAGRGNPDWEPELSSRIEASPAKDRVHRIDRYVDDDEMGGLFQAADAVVMPYREIDQSGVLFQAMRFGTPVLAFDVGALRDYVSRKIGMTTHDHTAGGLASLIVEHDAPRSAVIHKAAERYLWTQTVRTLIPLYKR